MKIGASYSDNICEFIVWAPQHKVDIILTKDNEIVPMEKTGDGYWKLKLKGIEPASEYLYYIDEKISKPDPASHFQPRGVFGPSAVVDHEAFDWKDFEWRLPELRDMVMYELHVGTFTDGGTFNAVLPRLKELADLGVNAVELMPITQFSGKRNWGYDSVFPYAVHNTYGGPEELKKLIQSCHLNGIAVILDAIYNHLGPEGNCLPHYGPYFVENRITPWGSSINFDGANSGQVRKYFLENALYWFEKYHVDALRLDAIHAIMDTSPKHILKELAEVVDHYIKKSRRKVYIIAETNQNNPLVVRSRSTGGYGLDAQWLDDFHHALHALITGEEAGYYMDFGNISHLAKALREGFVYSGQYSQFFKINRGSPSSNIPPHRFVVFSQNHDQIGNRALGERLITLVGLDAAKLAAAIVILSPYIPLFFMGEEYGEQAPFLFFTDFSDSALAENVRKGRREEHKGKVPPSEVPDPQSITTFRRSRLNWQQRSTGMNRKILDYYKKLLQLRKRILAQHSESFLRVKVVAANEKDILVINYGDSVALVANFSCHETRTTLNFGQNTYLKVLDSADFNWLGRGITLPEKLVRGEQCLVQPFGVAVYVKADVVKNFE